MSQPTPYRTVMFDLDATLAPSKGEISPATADQLCHLLSIVDVCIISGGRFEQFDAQPGGNDHPIRAMGIDSVEITGWQDTVAKVARTFGEL